jgi:E1A-binding protein p400
MSSGTPRSRKRASPAASGKSKNEASKAASAEIPPYQLEELRDQAIADQKTMLAQLMAERELALKEYLALRRGSSLGCFDPSNASLLAMAEAYHQSHPLDLDADIEYEESWSEEDDLQIESTKTDIFPPAAFQSTGISVSAASASQNLIAPFGSNVVASTTSPRLSSTPVTPNGARQSQSKASKAAAAAKRGPGRPPKTKDEMMPDLAPGPTRIIQATAASFNGTSSANSSAHKSRTGAMVATVKPRGVASPKPMKPFSSPQAGSSGSPAPSASTSTDAGILAAVSYVPFLTKNAGASVSKNRVGFPWHDAELFAATTSIFQMPTPMTMDPSWKERAKTDAVWLEKIGTLQKLGKLSTKRLEPVPEPPRNKTHWDFVLREMAWMAEDFKQDRYWKFETAKKLARAAQKFHLEKARQVVRGQKDREKSLRDKARWISRQVTSFWHDVEQLIAFKHRSSLDKHKKAAMDKNLDFFVQQTEQYSASLAIDLQKPSATAGATGEDVRSSSSTPAPQLAPSAPQSAPAIPNGGDAMNASVHTQDDGMDLDNIPDEDFKPSDQFEDDEDTIAAAEAEIHAETLEDLKASGHADEAAMLAAEFEMPIEDVLAQYGRKLGDEAEEMEEDEEDEDVGEVEQRDMGSELEDGSEDGEDDQEEGANSDDDRTAAEDRAKFGADFFARVAAHDPVATEQQHQSDKARLQAAADEARTLQPTGFTLATSQVKTPVPFLLQGTLREYQHIGLDWMVTMYEKKLNGILADEMGLGKTIMTISLLAHLACNGHWGPHLIVVPTSVLLNWEMELKRWCPQLKVLTYFGTPRQRKNKRTGWTKPNAFHVCLTSYKLVLQDAQAFKRMKWFYLILDEAHNIKNYKSQSWQTLLNFRTRRRLLLTGTPLQNNLMELWALMHFLMPHIFQSHKEFKDWFSNPVNSMIEGTSNYSDDLIRRLHSILRPFMLRRLKKDVEKQLPGKFEHIIMCKLSKRQRLLYDEYMARGNVQSTLKGGNYLGVANVLMQLRKVCNHPDLFEGRPIVSPFDQVGLSFSVPAPIVHMVSSDTESQAAKFLLAPQSPSELTQPLSAFSEEDDAHSLDIPEETFRETAPITTMSVVATTLAHKHSSGRVAQSSLGTPFSLQTFTPSAGKATPIYVPRASAATPTYLAHLAVHPESGGATPSGASSRGSAGVRATQQAAAAAAAAANAAVAAAAAPTSSTSSLNNPLTYIPPLPLPATSTAFIASAATAFNSFSASDPNGKQKMSLLANLNAAQVEDRVSAARQRLDHFAYVNGLRSHSKPLVVASETVALLLEDVAILKEHALAMRADPSRYLDYSNAANSLVLSPEERLEEMKAIIERFVCYIPKARAPPIKLNVAHSASSSESMREKSDMDTLKQEITPKLELMHSAHVRTQIYFPDKRLIQFDCGKLQMLALMLRQLKKDGHRCLIFTQMTRMLDVLEAFINLHGYTYLRLDGATKVEQRQKMMERFNHDKRVFLFILSTRSGGLGINLVGADTVIFYDTDWNPAMDAQAQDRCHRIGQTREVHIYRLISERTIEENILKKAKQKRQLDNIIKEGNFTTDFFKKVDIREMMKDSATNASNPNGNANGNDSMDLDAPTPRSSTPAPISAATREILIPGTAAAAEAASQTENADSFLDNPDMEAALMQAEDVADVEALKAVRREIAQEQKIDDTEGLEDEETPEWEAQLSAVHKLAMRYVELVNPSLDKNALAYAHQQITDETANWKDEAVKRLKLGRKLWHGQEDPGEQEDSETEVLASKPKRKKPKLVENSDNEEDEEEEEEEDQEEDQEEEDGEDDENQQDDDEDDENQGDEEEQEEGGAGDEMDENDENEDQDGDNADDDSGDDSPPKRGARSKGGRFKKRTRAEMSRRYNSGTSQPSFVSDTYEDLPLFYQVDKDTANEHDVIYRGALANETAFGARMDDPDQEELYLPPSVHLPGILEILSESSTTTDGYGRHEGEDDEESSFSSDDEGGESSEFTSSSFGQPPSRKKAKMARTFTLNPHLDRFFSSGRRRHREPPTAYISIVVLPSH